MRDSKYSKYILFNVSNLQRLRVLARRLSLDICCCNLLCALNATQTVLIEVWS